MSFSSSPRSRPLLSSSSSSGSERKEEDVVVSDVIKDEGGFEDDPVVARLPRLDFRTSLLLDVSLVLFPRHQRVAASPSPSSSPPKAPFDDDAFCFARRNRLAGVLYAKGSRHNKVLFSFSSSKSCKVNTVLMGLSKVVITLVFPDDFDPPFVSSSSTMNCQNRSHNTPPLPVVCDDDSDDDDDAFTFDPMTTTTLKAYS